MKLQYYIEIIVVIVKVSKVFYNLLLQQIGFCSIFFLASGWHVKGMEGQVVGQHFQKQRTSLLCWSATQQ
jgi:hypothetical protein